MKFLILLSGFVACLLPCSVCLNLYPTGPVILFVAIFTPPATEEVLEELDACVSCFKIPVSVPTVLPPIGSVSDPKNGLKATEGTSFITC